MENHETEPRPSPRLALLPAVLGLTLLPPLVVIVFLWWQMPALRGLGFLLVALLAGAAVCALALCLLLARALDRLARRVSALTSLDPEAPEPARGMTIAEVDRVDRALDAARRTIVQCARHAPLALLRALRQPEAIAVDRPESREMSVLVADVAGFSVLSASMSPSEAAELLNAYYARVAAAVEATGGTIDKFLGDAVFAYWGAPLAQPDHAARALAAAHAIVETIRAGNAGWSVPLRVRIGIDSGHMLVGPFGTASRTVYTVVGQPIQTAQCLEKMAKDVAPGADVIALASEATVEAAGKVAAEGQPVRATWARGRSDPAGVYRVA